MHYWINGILGSRTSIRKGMSDICMQRCEEKRALSPASVHPEGTSVTSSPLYFGSLLLTNVFCQSLLEKSWKNCGKARQDPRSAAKIRPVKALLDICMGSHTHKANLRLQPPCNLSQRSKMQWTLPPPNFAGSSPLIGWDEEFRVSARAIQFRKNFGKVQGTFRHVKSSTSNSVRNE